MAQTVGVPDGGPDPADVRMRVGPFGLTPRLELKNLGIDTNVFNTAEDQNPQSDFTFTLTPSIDAWLRMGRSWLKLHFAEDLLWYQEFANQRSANEDFSMAWRLPLNRLAITAAPSYASTNDRPGFEIDSRVHHVDWGGHAAIDVRAFPKTLFGVAVSYKNVTFDPTATYDGTNLAQELNRTETTTAFTIGYELTPLTKLSFDLGQQRDRFQNSPLRDADSTRASGTVSFDPHALLKGTASFGYRDFRPIDPSLAPFTGFTASGDLTYTLLGTTRFQVQFTRDIQYSYDINQPYYLQTGINGSIAQQIFGPFDAVVRAGTAKLAYQDRTGATVAVSDRVDYNHSYGGGIGYHFSTGMRLGFNADYYNRITEIDQRRYNAWRYGMSATYDF